MYNLLQINIIKHTNHCPFVLPVRILYHIWEQRVECRICYVGNFSPKMRVLYFGWSYSSVGTKSELSIWCRWYVGIRWYGHHGSLCRPSKKVSQTRFSVFQDLVQLSICIPVYYFLATTSYRTWGLLLSGCVTWLLKLRSQMRTHFKVFRRWTIS